MAMASEVDVGGRVHAIEGLGFEKQDHPQWLSLLLKTLNLNASPGSPCLRCNTHSVYSANGEYPMSCLHCPVPSSATVVCHTAWNAAHLCLTSGHSSVGFRTLPYTIFMFIYRLLLPF